MNGLRGVLLGLLVLVAWYLVVMATPAIHRAIFSIVPPDGELAPAERSTADAQITAYVRYVPPNSGELPALSREEQAHLDDVLAMNGILVLYVFPGILVGLLLTRWRLTEPLAITWSLGLVLVLGIVTAAGFDGAFSGLHRLLFPGGNWIFPAERYLLTQVYPIAFFAWAWGLILLCSGLTLWAIRATLAGNESR